MPLLNVLSPPCTGDTDPLHLFTKRRANICHMALQYTHIFISWPSRYVGTTDECGSITGKDGDNASGVQVC